LGSGAASSALPAAGGAPSVGARRGSQTSTKVAFSKAAWPILEPRGPRPDKFAQGVVVVAGADAELVGFFFETTGCTTVVGGVAAAGAGGAGRGRVLYTLSFCRGASVSGSTQTCFSQMRSPLQSVSLLHPAANAGANWPMNRHAISSERQEWIVMAQSSIKANMAASLSPRGAYGQLGPSSLADGSQLAWGELTVTGRVIRKDFVANWR
jgi:hypothetical protein